MIEALIRPARPLLLGLCAILSLLVAALYRPGIPGALLHILALFLVLRYGYMMIERGAWGETGNTTPDWRTFNQGFEQPVKLVGVITVFALIHGAVAYSHGDAAAFAVLLLVNLVGPASVVIIALGNSFVDALNPARMAGVISRTGVDYLAACLVLTLFSVAGNIILDFLLAAAAPATQLFLYAFCSYYYVLVVFFMMAWLVTRHREELIG